MELRVVNNELSKMQSPRIKYFFGWLLVFVLIVVAVLYEAIGKNDCPKRCQVALFSNSDQVKMIVDHSRSQSYVYESSETQQQGKNNNQSPPVAAAIADGKGSILIVSERAQIILMLQKNNGASYRCRVIYPEVDSRWCNIR